LAVSETVIEAIHKIKEVNSIEKAVEIFGSLSGATSRIFIEFILYPDTEFISRDFMDPLGYGESTVYRSMRILRSLGLVRISGKTEPIPFHNKWTGKLGKGGKKVFLYKLSEEYY